MRAAQDIDVLTPREGPGTPDRLWVRFGLPAVLVIVVDQLTKGWAVRALEAGPCGPDGEGCIDVFWTLRFHLVHNPGAAFSTGTSLGPVFAVIALAMVVVLTVMAHRRPDRWARLLLGLIAGGAVGNLIDRVARAEGGILRGRVVDFIDLQWWPVFNVADSAVVVGVVALVLYSMRHPDAIDG